MRNNNLNNNFHRTIANNSNLHQLIFKLIIYSIYIIVINSIKSKMKKKMLASPMAIKIYHKIIVEIKWFSPEVIIILKQTILR